MKNIPKIIESDSLILDKCSWWYNTNEGVTYRYDDAKESWVIISSSDADKESIINSAVNQSVYTANLYSDLKNSELESEIKAELHKLEKKIYPTCRYARHGRIDISNCNGVDYILVPCNLKCLLLYVTNNYLKTFCEKATFYDLIDKYNLPVYQINMLADPSIEKQLSEEEKNSVDYYVDLQKSSKPPRSYSTKTMAVTRADIMKAFSKWYSNNECILTLFDRSQMPADEILNNLWYIYTKSITTRHNKMGKKTGFGFCNNINAKHIGVYHPNKDVTFLGHVYTSFEERSLMYKRTLFHEIKTWHGIKQYVWCGFHPVTPNEDGIEATPENLFSEYFPSKMRYIKVSKDLHEQYKNDETKVCVSPAVLSRFPYMVFKNPFRKNVGGIIPIINGKLRLEYAKECKNRSLLLVSNNYQKLDFDEKGVCKLPLNPNFVEIFLPVRSKRKIGMYSLFRQTHTTYEILRNKVYHRRCIQFFKRWRIYWHHLAEANEYNNLYSYISRKHANKERKKRSTNPAYHMPRCICKRTTTYARADRVLNLWASHGWLEGESLPILKLLGNKMSLFLRYINLAALEIGRSYIYNGVNPNVNIMLFKKNLWNGNYYSENSKAIGFMKPPGLQPLTGNFFYDSGGRRFIKYSFLYGNSDTFSMYKCNPHYSINTITLLLLCKVEYNKKREPLYSYTKKACLVCKPGISINNT